LNIYVW